MITTLLMSKVKYDEMLGKLDSFQEGSRRERCESVFELLMEGYLMKNQDVVHFQSEENRFFEEVSAMLEELDITFEAVVDLCGEGESFQARFNSKVSSETKTVLYSIERDLFLYTEEDLRLLLECCSADEMPEVLAKMLDPFKEYPSIA